MRKSILPITLALTLVATLILVVLCFTASVYIAADNDMKTAEKNRTYTDKYYAAETTAAEIISGYADGSSNSGLTSGQSGKVTYDSPQGDILIIKASGSVSFSVPISAGKELDVIANASENHLNILKWTVE